METTRRIGPRAAALLLALGLFGRVSRADIELIGNGGFESGFTGWTREDQLGSDGGFLIQGGTASPVNGFPVPAPPEGLNAAMTDAQGPGSHVLYQDFVVPTNVVSGTLSFDVYINNQADFFSPDTLDFTSVDNQQARVDLLLASADPFSLAAADILHNAFRTLPGDPSESGYSTVVVDVSALLLGHAGETLRLRFAEADNQLFLSFGVDRVSLAVTVPEPSSLAGLAIGGLTAAGLMIRRRRRPGSAASTAAGGGVA